MRLAGALGGAGPLLQILSQHVLVTIQNFEAFLVLFFSLPIFELTYHTRVRYMLFAFPQIISLICCSTALRKLRLLNKCDYCSRGFYLLPPHPRFSCSCRNKHISILQRYNVFMVCYGIIPCFAVLSGVNPDEFTILYSVYVCQAVIHLLIVSVSPLSELCRYICSIFSLLPVFFYANVFQSLACLSMYLVFALVVSLVIRNIIQRMDAYLEVLEYTTFNHSLLHLVMSVFRALAPPEFLYRMMPSYSQQTYKHRLSTRRRKFLESYTLYTLPTILSTTSVESVPSMYALGPSSTPNLYTQTLYTSSTSSIFMDAESYNLHRKSMSNLKQHSQTRNVPMLTKDPQGGGLSPRPPVNPAFPYPLCLLPLPFRHVNDDANHEQGMLYSVLSASMPDEASSQSLHESKKDKINPEILRKRNPIVKYEVNVHIHERYILLCMIHVQRPVMSVLNSKTVYTLSDELNYLGLLNLLFSTLDYILSSFFSPKLCLHKLKVDTKAYYVYADLSSHASAMFKEQIEPVYPVDADIVNSSITKSKGVCLQTILTFAAMASYFANSMGLECTSIIVYTRTVMGFFGFEHHVFELVNPGLSLLNGILSNFYEIICDAPSASTNSATNPETQPAVLKLPSRYPSVKEQHRCAKPTKKTTSVRVTRQTNAQTINTDNRIFFINQVTGYNDAFSTQDFFTDIPQDIFISELINTDMFVNLLQPRSIAKSPHHSIYELLPPCYNLLPLPYRLRCSVQGLLRGARHDIICENSYFFEVLPRPELVYILMKLLIYSLAYDIRTTQPYPVEEVLNTANYDSLCANNKASCFADISLKVLQDPVLLNFMSLESYRRASIAPRREFRSRWDTDNSQSDTSPAVREKTTPCTSDSVFLHLFPVIPEAVFLPDVLLPNSFNQPLPNTIALPSIGFLAPYTRTAMRRAVAKGLTHKMSSNYDNRNVVNSRSDNRLTLAKKNDKRGCSGLTNCCTDDNTLQMLCTSSDPSFTFNVRTTTNTCTNTNSGTNITGNKWLGLTDMLSESSSSFRASNSTKNSEKRTALSTVKKNKSRLSLTRFPSLTFTARNVGNLLHMNPLQMLPLPKGKWKDSTADFSSRLQFFGDPSIEMQMYDSEDSSSLTQFQGTCYSTMSRHLGTFSDILKNLSNCQTLEHIYDIEFSPIDDDCLMFYGTARHVNKTSQFSGRMSAQEYYKHVLNAHTISKESIARYQEELYDGMLILFPEANDIVPRDILLINSKLLTRQLSRSVKGFLFPNKSQSLELLSNQVSDSGKSELKVIMNLAETATATSEEILSTDVDIIELSDKDKALPYYKDQHQRFRPRTRQISKISSISAKLARSRTKNNLMRNVPHSAISSDTLVSNTQSYNPMLLEKSTSKANLSSSSQAFGNTYTSSGHGMSKPSSDHCHSNSTTVSPVTDILGQNVVIKEVHLLSSIPPSDSTLVDLDHSDDDKSLSTLELVADSTINESSSLLLETLSTRTSEDTQLSTIRGKTDDVIAEPCRQYSQSVDHVCFNVITPSLAMNQFNPSSGSGLSSSDDSLSVSSSILSNQNGDIVQASRDSDDSLDNSIFNLVSSPLDCPALTSTTYCEAICSNGELMDSTCEIDDATNQATNPAQRASTVLSVTYQKAEECIATHTTSSPCLRDITHSMTSSSYYSQSSSDEDSTDRRYTKSLESDDDIRSVVGITNLSLVDDIIFQSTSVCNSDTHTQMDFQMDRHYSVKDLHESSGNSPFQNIKLFVKKPCADMQHSMKIAQLSRENSLEARALVAASNQPDHQYHVALTGYIVDSRSPTPFVDSSKIPDEGVATHEASSRRTKLRFSASAIVKILFAWCLRMQRLLKGVCLGPWLRKQASTFEETESYTSDKENSPTRAGLSKADISASKQTTRHVFDSIPYLNHLFETLQSTSMLLPVFSFILYNGTKRCPFLFRLMGPNFSMLNVLFQANVLLFVIQLLVLRDNTHDNGIFDLAHNYVSTLAPIPTNVLKQAFCIPLRSIMVMCLKLVIRVVELLNSKLQWALLHRICISIRDTVENILSSVALSWNSERTYFWILAQFITGKGMSLSALRLTYVLVFLPTVYLIFLYYDRHARKCQTQHKIVPLELSLYALLVFINAYYIELLLNFQIIQMTRLLKTIKLCRSELKSMRDSHQLVVYTALQAACLENSVHMRGVLTRTILDFFLTLLGIVTYWFILSSVVTVPPLLLSINNIVIFICSLVMKFSVFKVAPYVLLLQALLCLFIFKYVKPFLISYILIMKAKVSILLNWYQSQRIFQFVISDHMFALLLKSLRMHENLSILKDKDGEINNEMAKNMGLRCCTLPDDSTENDVGSVSAICRRYKRLSINNCGFIAQTHTSIRGSITDMTVFLFDSSISNRTLSHRYLLYRIGDFIWNVFNEKILQPAKLYGYGIGLLSELKDPLQEHTAFGLKFVKEGDVSHLENESFSQQFSDSKCSTQLIVGTSKHICEELSHWKACPVDYFYDSTLRVSPRSASHFSPRYASSRVTQPHATLKDLRHYWKHKREDVHQLRNELKDAFAAADEFVLGYTSYNDSRTLGMRRYADVSPNSICMIISFSNLFSVEASAEGSKSTSCPGAPSSMLPFRTQTNDAFYYSSIQFQIIREFIEILYLYLARFGRHIVVTLTSFYKIEMYTKCSAGSCSDEMVNNVLSYVSNTQLNLLSLFKSARTMLPIAMRTLNNKYLKKIYGKEKPFISNSSLSSMNAPFGEHHRASDSNHKLFSESMTVSVEESTAGLLSDETGASDLTNANIKYTKEELCTAICLCDMLALGEYMRDYFVKRVRRVLSKACISIGIAHGLCIETILGNHGHPFCIHGAAVSKARYIAECVQFNSIGISDAADHIHTKLKAVLDRLVNYGSCNLDKMKERFAGKNPTLANIMSAHNLVAAYSRTLMKESYGYSVGE